jgi:hypothetical protein
MWHLELDPGGPLRREPGARSFASRLRRAAKFARSGAPARDHARRPVRSPLIARGGNRELDIPDFRDQLQLATAHDLAHDLVVESSAPRRFTQSLIHFCAGTAGVIMITSCGVLGWRTHCCLPRLPSALQPTISVSCLSCCDSGRTISTAGAGSRRVPQARFAVP